MKVKTSELSGTRLDWAVAKAEGHDAVVDEGGDVATFKTILGHEYKLLWKASTEWAQGGPIIERVGMHLIYLGFGGEEEWEAYILSDSKFIGQTPLIAAMRCYVASKLGEKVEVSSELMGV